jgi:tetratricopeptide (TPR) repeat protein
MAVADTYVTRGQLRQATGIYRQVLGLAPMDISVRHKLIELLAGAGDVDRAIEECVALADAHYRMAQVDQAIEAYNQALRLAGRAARREAAETRILHLLGDTYVQSVDWNKARKTYQRIVALAPADLPARQRLIEMAFKVGDRRAGLSQLDEMLNQLTTAGAPADAGPLLRELGKSFALDTDVQSRLVRAYQRLSLHEDAVAALNALGELQLDNGRFAEAADTVRQLMALEPEKAGDYQVLIEQILGRTGKSA